MKDKILGVLFAYMQFVGNYFKKNWKFGLLFLIVLSIGWFGGYSFYKNQIKSDRIVLRVRENSPQYKFINPLIFVGDSLEQSERYNSLRNKVEDYVSKNINNADAKDISFFFKDLNQGDWVGVRENNLYAPASMLKVSILLAYLRMVGTDPSILLKTAYYAPTDESVAFHKPTNKLKPGYYTIKALLQQTMVESDNDSMHTLNSLYPQKVLDIYQELQLPDPLQEKLDFMSPVDYSYLFRSIYNGNYLSHQLSEEALRLLSHTNFDQGIVAGVPKEIVVSHKFGELNRTTDGTVPYNELHDCGIVYYPPKPYFICVMTKGDNFANLADVIADISKITFDFMKNYSDL